MTVILIWHKAGNGKNTFPGLFERTTRWVTHVLEHNEQVQHFGSFNYQVSSINFGTTEHISKSTQ